MKKIILGLLQSRARRVLKRHRPTVVAITGSMGKTSTKQAIEIVLSTKHHVRAPKKNFNNEWGVPFTILGIDNPRRSVAKWIKALVGPLPKDYPDVLILEFGADHPGDIAALCDLAPPKIGVVTGISSVHAEAFLDIEALAAEKAKLVEALPSDGVAILNADDERTLAMRDQTHARAITYGLRSSEWSIQTVMIETTDLERFDPNTIFAVTTAEVMEGVVVVGRLELKNCLGYAPALSCLAGVSVGRELGIDPVAAIEALNDGFKPVPGRLNPIAGIKGTLIIDDSYNAAPKAMANGLEMLKLFTPGESRDRRIAVLGQMAELGKYSDDEHRLIGLKAADCADIFLAVGERMRTAINAATEAGMDSDKIEWFATSAEAGVYLDRLLQEGDVVYVKGSQSSRMEKVVKAVMAEPLKAAELLVRQDDFWLKS